MSAKIITVGGNVVTIANASSSTGYSALALTGVQPNSMAVSQSLTSVYSVAIPDGATYVSGVIWVRVPVASGNATLSLFGASVGTATSGQVDEGTLIVSFNASFLNSAWRIGYQKETTTSSSVVESGFIRGASTTIMLTVTPTSSTFTTMVAGNLIYSA